MIAMMVEYVVERAASSGQSQGLVTVLAPGRLLTGAVDAPSKQGAGDMIEGFNQHLDLDLEGQLFAAR